MSHNQNAGQNHKNSSIALSKCSKVQVCGNSSNA